jgi:tetratricopeptide (TPR) repeat protein
LGGEVQTVLPLPAKPMPIRFARTRLSWPVGSDVHWRAYVDGLTVKPVKQDGYMVLDMPVPLDKEEEMPADVPLRYRRVALVEATSFDDWASVSRAMAPLYATEGTIADGSDLAAEVAKIEAASSDPRVRAAAALRLVQDKVRYLFKGMDGGNYVPQAPAKTWEVRYGDCKAKSLLLLAILHKLGITAEPVLANSALGGLLEKRLPSAAAFDHVLVRATIDGRSLWLDGTRTGDRLADIYDTPDFVEVLPVRAEGAGLLPIESRPDARPQMAIALDMDQRAGIGFPSPYTISFTFRGPLAEQLHTVASQAGEDQIDDLVTPFVQHIMGNPYITTTSVDYDGEAGTATAKATGVVWEGWQRDDRRFELSLGKIVSDFSFAPDRSRAAWRNLPVRTGGDGSMEMQTRIRLPDGGKGFTFSGATTLPARIANTLFERTTSLDGGVMTVTDRMSSLAGEIAPENIAAARAAAAALDANPLRETAPADYAPAWQRAQAGLAAHSFADARKALDAAIADDPDEAQPYINSAAFHSSVFEWKQAMADLDHAIALAPSANNYLSRANVRMTLGDYAAAAEDLEEARKLEPESIPVIVTLAGALSDMGETRKAVELLDAHMDAAGDDAQALLAKKASVLVDAGQAEAALAAAEKAAADKPHNAVALNNRCWTKGTLDVALDAALADCTKSIEIADSPASVLDSRAMVYFRMGRMEDALADLDAALAIAPGQAASLFMRGVIRKRRGLAGAAADLAAARLMSPQIDKDYARYGIKP